MSSPPATAVLPAVMGAIADQVRAELADVVLGLQVEPRIVMNPTPPCIDIYPADPFLARTSFGPVNVEAAFAVRARVTAADSDAGQDLLLAFMDPRAAESLWAALESDRTFGGVVADSAVQLVTGFIPYDVVAGPLGGYSGALHGAEWRLTVEFL